MAATAMAPVCSRYMPRIWPVRAPTAFIAPIWRIWAVSMAPSMVATRIELSSSEMTPKASSIKLMVIIWPWCG